ncbi:hypothetical protein JMN32_26890 [Fulvivirga sp. 29W222]|uniref:Uncharacterized protein n=1 Tax=Fulvivirga marina TaxID=2494733 RepID=A0A937G1K5_9BACT|nr:hypothetical protein [Fulvivirga marina]MBL6449969.1 hypothetical protein [Fulvivirga marina]
MRQEETEDQDYDVAYEGYESWNTKNTTAFIQKVTTKSGVDPDLLR